MKYTTDIKSYLKQIQTDVLPSSNIGMDKQNNSGQYVLDRDNYIEFMSQLPDSRKIYSHEKCTPSRLGVKEIGNDNIYKTIYYRHYNGGVMNSFSKIIVNSVLNLYPTPLNVYGSVQESATSHSFGISTIDLNNLKNARTGEDVVSVRLDILLHSLGLEHEISSYMDFQKMLESGKLSKVLTPRAIVQVGLGSIFIPNAVGETDANSRNMILLKNKNDEMFDLAVRIDGESNTYITDVEKSRSGKKQVPKGIYMPNEDLEVYLSAIASKDVAVDWNLFSQFNTLARTFCSRSNIDNAVTKTYMMNSGKMTDRLSVTGDRYFGQDAFYDFSRASIDRSDRYFNKVFSALGAVAKEPPFASNNNKYKGVVIEEEAKPDFLSQKIFDKNGKEM